MQEVQVLLGYTCLCVTTRGWHFQVVHLQGKWPTLLEVTQKTHWSSSLDLGGILFWSMGTLSGANMVILSISPRKVTPH